MEKGKRKKLMRISACKQYQSKPPPKRNYLLLLLLLHPQCSLKEPSVVDDPEEKAHRGRNVSSFSLFLFLSLSLFLYMLPVSFNFIS